MNISQNSCKVYFLKKNQVTSIKIKKIYRKYKGCFKILNMKKIIKSTEYVFIVLLGLLLSCSYLLFITPNHFAPAGINGIAVMVQYTLNFSIGFMSLIINVPLCIFAYFFVDKKFAVKTFVFCVCYSLFYLLLQYMFNKYPTLKAYQYDAFAENKNGIDTIYPVLIAGLISGFCYGLLFRFNGSTGGTDIIAKYISKKRPYLNFFWVMFILNALVAICSMFVYSENGIIDYKPACLCMLYCFTSSFIGNLMLKGYKSAYKFIIVSKNVAEIEKEIIENLHHSATRINGKGIYSGEQKQVLLCIVNKHQIVDFSIIIKKYPDTFAFIENVNETLGNFKKIK